MLPIPNNKLQNSKCIAYMYLHLSSLLNENVSLKKNLWTLLLYGIFTNPELGSKDQKVKNWGGSYGCHLNASYNNSKRGSRKGLEGLKVLKDK